MGEQRLLLPASTPPQLELVPSSSPAYEPGLESHESGISAINLLWWLKAVLGFLKIWFSVMPPSGGRDSL